MLQFRYPAERDKDIHALHVDLGKVVEAVSLPLPPLQEMCLPTRPTVNEFCSLLARALYLCDLSYVDIAARLRTRCETIDAWLHEETMPDAGYRAFAIEALLDYLRDGHAVHMLTTTSAQRPVQTADVQKGPTVVTFRKGLSRA